jgi:uncharacterized phage protein (TIGR01671 family)
MRQIKFRCWHIKRKEMYQIGNITFKNNWIGASSLNVLNNSTGDTLGINYLDNSNKEFELMQFIGSKDKNENEIYEGDILQYFFENGEKSKQKFIVKWMDFENKFYGIFKGGYSFEVIGNIYQSPELLSGEAS